MPAATAATSPCATWAETAFWAAEKATGATGVAASPNLLLDLLVTMPWYVAMVAALWIVQRHFRYPWTTVALLGGLYEVGADGCVRPLERPGLGLDVDEDFLAKHPVIDGPSYV